MQGLADGYFILPYTIQNYLADQITVPLVDTKQPEFQQAEEGIRSKINKLMQVKGEKPVDTLHKDLGHIMWELVGMGRTKETLNKAIEDLKKLKDEFWSNVFIPGKGDSQNVELEKAIRLDDFIEASLLMAYDGLERNESCGGHFREEFQTPDGEALRDDEHYSYVACWKYTGDKSAPELVKEPLDYEFVERQQRNYKS